MPTTSQKKPVRYMDFVSHKPKANADPLASRPASRPVAKPKPVAKVHSVADQIPPKGVHKPVEHHPERAPKIETSNTVSVKKREEKPYISRTPATSRDLYAKAIDPNQPKERDDLAIKAAAAISGSAKPAPKAPDNNAYSLGGKSPFLPNYIVSKRPLSDSVPTKKRDNYEKLSFLGVNEEPTSRKNVYDKANKLDKTPEKGKKAKTVKVIDDTKKKRGVPTWLVIIITIILGAAVGAGVYFLLPK
ncbi:hypothetical protein IKF74_00090 [Candidatus Saccharibacteria bacterium]|nr:hypothetical protein [Candidatus Saccharibacteria bacterium]